MSSFMPRGFGWRRDLPDYRDYTPQNADVAACLASLTAERHRSVRAALPDRVDWREYFSPVEDQLHLGSSCAHACIGLLQFFERLSHGRSLELSRLFLYRAARRLANAATDEGTELRTTLKALVRFGVPPEKYWPYDPARLDVDLDPFTVALADEFRSVMYVRLDAQSEAAFESLDQVRAFLAAGFPCAFGFSVYTSLSESADVSFPTIYDGVRGGQAVVAVGYDDHRRIRSEKGALLIRNSWGTSWGDGGYGWLPYGYLRARLASDFWTLVKVEWLESGEFRQP